MSSAGFAGHTISVTATQLFYFGTSDKFYIEWVWLCPTKSVRIYKKSSGLDLVHGP